jgi:hypothetical protein
MIGYNKYYIHRQTRLNEIFESNTYYDILFIGSSRTHTSINPKIIDSITGHTSYNAGIEGGNLLEFLMTFKGYLQNHQPPKILVLTLDVNSLSLDRKFFNYLQYFTVLNNRIVDSTLSSNGINTFVPKYLPVVRLLKYDEMTRSQVINGLRGRNEIREGEFDYKGYLSNTNLCTDTTKEYPLEVINISGKALNDLMEFTKVCEATNTRLVMTYAPEYKFRLQKSFTNFSQAISLIDAVSKKKSIPFYRDDYLNICNNPCFFANYGHLNTIGAMEYSKIIGARILTLNIFK